MAKSFRLLSVLVFWMWATGAAAQTVSLTFDDGLDPTKQQSAGLWNDQIIAGLKHAAVTAMVFPSLSHIGGEAGIDLIRAWAQAGHSVGNHTSKHRSLSSPNVTLDDFISDVVEGDAALSGIPGFVPMLRFPLLKKATASKSGTASGIG